MESPRWLVAPGPLLNKPPSCWPIWNGGVPTTILSALTITCAWHSCSHEREGVDCWRNAIASVPLPWQWDEPTDDGQRGMCSPTHCLQFPLESHVSEMRLQEHVVERLVKVPAEAVGWASLRGEMACPDCPLTKKPSERRSQGLVGFIHHVL